MSKPLIIAVLVAIVSGLGVITNMQQKQLEAQKETAKQLQIQNQKKLAEEQLEAAKAKQMEDDIQKTRALINNRY